MEQHIVVLILLIAMTTAAPVESDSKAIVSDPSSVSESAEQIMYGNHQNDARQKQLTDADDGEPAKTPAKTPDTDTSAPQQTAVEASATKIGNIDRPAAESGGSQHGVDDLTVTGEQSDVENDISDKALDGNFDLDYYLYDYAPAVLRDHSKVPVLKKRRSVPLTAENMAGASEKTDNEPPSRVRRDLTDDEIQALLAREEEPYPSADDNDVIPDRDVSSLIQRLQENGDYYETENAVAERVAAERLAEEAAEERLAILQYLYEHPELEAPYEAPSPEPRSLETPDVQPVEYQPVVYQGQMGLFVPLKRSYMSLVPGARKRSSPYGQNYYGLDDESLRNLDEYKRLYTLAEELNGAKKK